MKNSKFFQNICSIYKFKDLELYGSSKYGVSNLNYFAKSGSKKYYIKIYSLRKKRVIKKINKFYQSFFSSHVEFQEILLPIPTFNNNFYTSINDSFVFLYPYIEGKHFETVNKDQIKQITNALNRFHALNILDKGDLEIFKKNVKTLISIKGLKTIDSDIVNIDNSMYSALEFLAYAPVKNQVNSLLHGDPDFSNFLFSKNKLIALLDIDECYMGDDREEIIKTILIFTLLRGGKQFSKIKAKLFAKEFNKRTYEKSLIDFYTYQHIFNSLETFLNKQKTSPSDLNIAIIKYFVNLFNAYQKNRNELQSIILA